MCVEWCVQGHAQGYERLIDALGWCLDLGIEVVSVYAFSVENFKRSQQEVDALMELAAVKLRTMLRESFDMLERHQVSVRVIGDLDRLPRDVQRAAAEVMIATAHHTRAALNICLAYTGRQDMLQAMEAVQVRALKKSVYVFTSPFIVRESFGLT
jgi:ditrans,polycis-polyprenyl diphosphate synthase